MVLVGDEPLDDDAATARRHLGELAAQEAADVRLTDACKRHHNSDVLQSSKTYRGRESVTSRP